MKKNIAFMLGGLLLVLAFGLVLAGCAKKFDGSSLVGTTWVGESSEDLSSYGAGKYTVSITVQVTSDTAGTQEVKITKYEGNWSDEWKTKVQGMIAEQNGDFSYTYDAATHTGKVTTPGGKTPSSFAVDVSAKTLTIEPNGDETVLKLK